MALARNSAKSDPACGSVRFMVPVHSPGTSRGRFFCFCASIPRRRIASITPLGSSDTKPKSGPFHISPSTSPTRSSGAHTPPANFAASSSTELTRSDVASSQPARLAMLLRSASSSIANCMSLTGALYVLIACSSRALMNLLILVQKPVNDRRDVSRLRHQEHVAVVDHVQLGAPNERRQDPGVDEGHDRIVQAVHDERGLRQQPQPGKAGPSGGRDQLIEVAAVARRP